MLLTRWHQFLNRTRNTLASGRKAAPRPSYRPRGSRVDVLEDRTLLAATLTLDFGFGFPSGGLTIKDSDMGSPINGPTVFGSGHALVSLTSTVVDQRIDLNGDLVSNAADAHILAAQVVEAVRRSFDAFDVTVQTRDAANLANVASTLAEGDSRSHDTYIFVAGARPASFTDGTGVSQIDANNSKDNLAFAFADSILKFGPTPKPDAQSLAALAIHESGHAFGATHNIGDALIRTGDVMGGAEGDYFTTDLFTRFPLPNEGGGTVSPGSGLQNHYEVMKIASGLRENTPAYVTGTGAFDRITITRIDSTTAAVATVLVEPFSDATFTTSVATPFNYTIGYSNGIVVEGGYSSDLIQLDGDFDTTVSVRGAQGVDQLVIKGRGAAHGTYAPGINNTNGGDGNSDRRGRLVVGGTTIDFLEFDPGSSVTVQDVGSFTLTTPLSNDALVIDSPASGRNRVSGTSGGVPLVPLALFNVTNFTIDTATNDNGSPADVVRLDSPGWVASGLQNVNVSTGNGADHFIVAGLSLPVAGGAFTFNAGMGADKVSATGDANFVLSDAGLGIVLRPEFLTFNSVSKAVLTGGDGSSNIRVSNWSGMAKIDGAGGSDTLSVLGRNVVRDAIVIGPSADPSFPSAVTLGVVGAATVGTIDFANVETLAVAGGNESSSVRPGFPILGDEFTVTPLTGVLISVDGGDPSVLLPTDPLAPPPPSETLFIDGDRLTLRGEVSLKAGPGGSGQVRVKRGGSRFDVLALDYQKMEVIVSAPVPPEFPAPVLALLTGFPFVDSSIDAGPANGSPDRFVLKRLGDDLTVLINGAPALRSPLANFNNLTVIGSSDADSLTIDYSGGNPVPAGGLSFEAGSGSDTLAIDDGSATDSPIWNVTSSSVTRGSTVFAYQGVENLAVTTGQAGDQINVRSTSAATTISTSDGADQVIVGQAGSVQAILGPLTIDNRNSFSILVLDDSADTTGRSVTVTGSSVTGLAPAAINWVPAGVITTQIKAGSGSDSFSVSPGTATRLVINANNPLIPATPGDRMDLNLSGVVEASLQITGLGEGEWSFANRRQVAFTGLETLTPAPEIQVLDGTTNLADGGTVVVGTTVRGMPIDKVLTVRNAGTANLTLGAIRLPTGFQLVSAFEISSLAAGASTTFKVRLNGTTAGTVSGPLSFSDNDLDENPFDLTLSGTVNAPEIQVLDGTTDLTDGSSLSFGTTGRGFADEKTLTVKNVGTSALTLGSLSSLPTGFQLVSGFGASTLAPNAMTTVRLRLTATTIGTFGGPFSFTNNDGNESPFNLTLSGSVVTPAPEIQVLEGTRDLSDGSFFTFGTTVLGIPIDKIFTVRNVGFATLTLGPFAALTHKFELVSGFGSSSLAPGASTMFTVRLKADMVGSFSGSLVFSNNDADEGVFDLSIAGQVNEPSPEIDVFHGTNPLSDGGTLDFGSSPQGMPVTKTLTVKNTGTAPLTLGPITLPDGFKLATAFTATTVSPGSSTSFGLQLTAANAGIVSGSLSIGNNDGNENPFDLTLAALVQAPLTTSPSAKFSPIVASPDPSGLRGSVANVRLDFNAVGDGIHDDTAAIQAAINSLPATGGTVFFPAGTYLISQGDAARGDNDAAALLLRSNIDYVGTGLGSTLLLKSLQDPFTRMMSTDVDSTSQNITIRGLHFDGNRNNQGPGNNEHQHAVFLSGASNVLVEGNVFHDTSGDAVYAHQNRLGQISDHVLVQNNEMHSLSRVGVNFDGTSNSIARANYIHDTLNNSMKMEQDAPVLVTNNQFIGNMLSHTGGISLSSTPGFVSDMLIADNTFVETLGGVNLGEVSQIRVIQNSFTRVRDADAVIIIRSSADITVQGNQISEAPYSGAAILVHSSAEGGTLPKSQRIVIDRNVIRNNAETAIKLSDSAGAQITNNLILNNISPVRTDPGNGIQLAVNTHNTLIAGNTIHGNNGVGILVLSNSPRGDGAHDNRFRNNVISGNALGGAWVVSDAGPNNEFGTEAEPGLNSFQGNTGFGLKNDLTAAVEARSNFWGGRSGPNTAGADGTLGNIVFQPFLTTAPQPVATAPAPMASFDSRVIPEGGTATVAFARQYHPNGTIRTAGFRYSFDFDNDGTFEVGNGTYAGSGTTATAPVPTRYLAEGPQIRLVKGRIIGQDGRFTDYTTALSVINVAPRLNGVMASPIDASGATRLTGSFTDAGIQDNLTLLVHWGDGRRETVNYAAGISSFSLPHQYQEHHPSGVAFDLYPISVTFLDDDGGVATANAIAAGNSVRTVRISDAAVTEGTGSTVTATFTVSLSAASTIPVSVRLTTSDGTATAPSDYVSRTATLTFAPGETSKTFTVTVAGDTLREGTETFFVTLTNACDNTLPNVGDVIVGDGLGIGTITDNDALPTLSINDLQVAEAAGTVTFNVTLSAASGQTVTVNYSTADDSAKAGSDYTSKSGTLTFPAGSTTQTVTVSINNDSLDELNERLFVNLSSPNSSATIQKGQGAAAIIDNDPTPTLSIIDVQVAEAAGTATFNVTLSAASGQTVTVSYATADDSAKSSSPSDYTAKSGTLTFAPGVTSQPVTVSIVNDTLDEINERFFVNLSGPSITATLLDSQGVATIIDDDAAPTLSISDPVAVSESAGQVTFNVTLSAASGQTVTVKYATADDSAQASTPSDYTAKSGTLTFAAGVILQPVTVLIVNDTRNERSEQFIVNLSSPSISATILKPQGVVTITDDDRTPTLSINDPVAVSETTGTVTFTVRLSAASGLPVTVNFATASQTATSPADYISNSGTMRFAPDETTKSITVNVVDNTLAEPTEIFVVNLSAATNATLSDNQGLATINDNDLLPSLTVNDVTVTEGTGGTVNAVFTITLSAPTGQDVRVTSQTASNTATAPGDYQGTGFTVVIPSGMRTATFTVPINPDLIDELDERFFVNLSNPVNATISDAQGIGTIRDDDESLLADLLGNGLDAIPNRQIAAWGDTIRVDAAVLNAGAAPSGPFQMQWYLSRDAVGSSDDVLLPLSSGASSYSHAAIGTGDDGYAPFFSVDLRLPAALPSGWSGTTFHIVMKSDSGSQVNEGNGETNNFGQLGRDLDSDLIAIAAPFVDLSGRWLSVPTIADLGRTIDVTASILNNGNRAAVAFGVEWYLSRDSVGSVDDVRLPLANGSSSYSHPAITPDNFGIGPDFTVSLKLPSALPSGWTGTSFFVVMRTDSANQVAESNESNNFGQVGDGFDSSPIALTFTPIDPDDQISEAILLGSANDGPLFRPGQSIEVVSDVDMLKFSVSVGSQTVPIPQRLAFDIDSPSGGLNSYLRLFNSSGTQLAANDDAPAPGEAVARESYLIATINESGTYYLGVSGFSNIGYHPVTGEGDTTGSTGAYQITVTNITNQASAQAATSPAVSLQLAVPSAASAGVAASSGGAGGLLESISSQPSVNGELSQSGSQGVVAVPSVASLPVTRAIGKAPAIIVDSLQGQLIDQVMGGWGVSGASLVGWTP